LGVSELYGGGRVALEGQIKRGEAEGLILV
jgi:hypothetical protein